MVTDPNKKPVDYAPAPDPSQEQIRGFIRYGLMLSSMAMLAFALLTFVGVRSWTS
jgi:hypothetical protein